MKLQRFRIAHLQGIGLTVNLNSKLKKDLKVGFAGLKVVSYAQTDVGQKRDQNEDRFLLMPSENFFAVADGMGGHAGGGIASAMAVTTIESVIITHSNILSETQNYNGELEANPVAKLISDAIRNACHVIYQEGRNNESLYGMGTTVTSLLIFGEDAFIAHVGDSRAYLLRDKQLVQLTEDHSLINEQLKAGLITLDQAQNSRFKNVITRSVGFENDVDVDMVALKAVVGDIFMLCSDGLTGLVADQEIANILNNNNLEETPQLLIDLANKRGGDDNITILVARIDELKKQ